MKLVKETDPILKKVLQPFDFENPIMSPQELVAEMHRIRKGAGGVGLAASQIGIDARVIVIGMGGFETEGVTDFETAYFNPVVKSLMQGEIKMIEGCLSFPDLFIEIKRKQNLTMSWHDVDNMPQEEMFSGITSRIIQHELDHLEGIVFIQRADRYHLEKGRKGRKLSQRRTKRLAQKI